LEKFSCEFFEFIFVSKLVVEVLTSIAIVAETPVEILLTGFGLVIFMEMDFAFQFILTMSERTCIAELASSSMYPILTELSLQFFGIILNEFLFFLEISEVLTLGLNINFE